MTHTIDPRDPSAYDRFNRDERLERDLTPPDRAAVHTAAQTRARWSWGKWLTLAALIACGVAAFADALWPLLHGGW